MRTITYFNPFSLFLFLLVMFPYVSVVNTPFDTQPYALVFAGLLLVLFYAIKKDLEIPKLLIPFLIITLYAVFRSTFQFEGIDTLRSLVGYVSVVVIGLASYATFKHVKGKYFITSVWIWFVFGVLQNFVSKSLGTGLVARMATSEDRGVTSLAVEPSSYAIICLFFFVLNDVFYTKEEYSKKTYIGLFALLTLQLMLSKSALGFLIFGVYLAAKFIFNKGISRKVLSFFVFLSVAVVGYLLFTEIPSLQQTRVGSLLYTASINPMNLIYHDGSISDRLSHILVSFASLFHSYGLGFGIAEWDYHALDIANNSGQFIYSVTQVHFTLGRIMSAWGTAVFELGIIGLMFPITFIVIMARGAKRVNDRMKYVYKVSLVTIFVMMLMSVPIAFPLFGYMIGMFVYIQLKEHKLEQTTN